MESIERVSKTLELLKNTSSPSGTEDLLNKARDLLWKVRGSNLCLLIGNWSFIFRFHIIFDR